MSIVKIQGVRNISSTLNYMIQETKTRDDLITTFDCDKDYMIEDFKELYEERKSRLRKDTTNKAKMIIQSFNSIDNITPEQAHEIGVKLADEYLKGNHQYIVTTHTDTDYIHNHIVFNQVRTDNLLMFDTTRKNTIDNLRLENDKLSREYDLEIPQEKSHENKIKYISQTERKVKEKGKSFKEELENNIDTVIENSNSYDDFINQMELLGFKSKEGKHIAFLNEKTNKFMRTKTLGMNYTENSIKYRIENKDFQIQKFKYTVETKLIDKSQDKIKNNYGLRKWVTKQNISHLQAISNLVFNENKTIKEIENIKTSEEEFNKDVENNLMKRDDVLHDLDKKSGAFEEFKDSANLISKYKESDNKTKFKKANYSGFKKFDNAKKDIYLLKKNYGINNLDELLDYKSNVEKERNQLYRHFTKIQTEKVKEKNIEKERTLENKKIKNRTR